MDPYLVTMLLTCTALQLPLPTHVSYAQAATRLYSHPVWPVGSRLQDTLL